MIFFQTVLAHGIYLSDSELSVLRQTGAGISHCPNSNLRYAPICMKSSPFSHCEVTDHKIGEIPVALKAVTQFPFLYSIRSGFCDVRRLLNNQVKVGLGTG